MGALGQVVQRLPDSVRRVVERHRHTLMFVKGLRGVQPRSCPLCGYVGRFRASGLPPEPDAQCRECDSLARHRLFVLMDTKYGILTEVESLLHFAPEQPLHARFRARYENYVTADMHQRNVDHRCNIEDTGLADRSFDAIFASDVLEHGDDSKILRELHRLLAVGGKLIARVPIAADGFEVSAYTATPEECAQHALSPGEKVFVATRRD